MRGDAMSGITELPHIVIVGGGFAGACLQHVDCSEKVIRYDHLVLALGSVARIPHVPGLREYGFGMKSLADAVALRDRAVGLLELAHETENAERRQAMLTFVVVGGNHTGVEVAGE